jgi:hypothetical protein
LQASEEHIRKCLVEVKEAKVWGKEVPRDIEKCFVTISKGSPSLLSDVWHVEVESSESLASSTRKLEVSSKFSWKM